MWWWVGTVLFCVQKKGLIFKQKMTPFFASFDTTPSPHRRINAPRSLLAFAHIHSEAHWHCAGGLNRVKKT